MADCLRKKTLCPADLLSTFINGDDSETAVIGEKSKLQNRGVMTIHQANKIHLHFDYRKGDKWLGEDAAIIMLEEPIPFQVDNTIFTESYLRSQSTRSAGEFSDDKKPSLLNFFHFPKEERALPLEDCFFTDWRIPTFIYHTSQLLTYKSFSHLAEPFLNTLRAEMEKEFKAEERNFPKLPLPFFEKDIFIENSIFGFYELLFEDKRYTAQYTTDYSVQAGYSGGPLWCYSLETGLFLKGHAVYVFMSPEIFFTRNFDEDIYQWIVEQM